MKLTARQYAQTLLESLQDTDAKHHEQVMDNFAEALRQNNDLKMFDEIAEEFERLEKAAKGIRIADVTTARPLDKGAEAKIIDELNRLVNGKVELRKKVDEKVLGGVVIRMEDTLIDASARKSLDELRKSISE